MVDLATNYHMACLLKTRDSAYVARKFIQQWIAHFGVPWVISLDQGGEFAGLFARLLEEAAIPSRVSGAHASWQQGVVERHNGILGHMLSAVLYNNTVKEWADIKVALASTVQAKNACIRRSGYSPEQFVFGRSLSWMWDLCDNNIWANSEGSSNACRCGTGFPSLVSQRQTP
eukprot:637380-Amphidinium_carterae.2